MYINKRALRITLSLVAIAGLTAALGNACSQMQSASTAVASSGLGGGTCTAASIPAFAAVNGAPTPGIVYGTNGTASNVVQNMVACLGMSIANLSQTTLNDINARTPNFPATSYIGNVSSSSLMAIAAVAYDVCMDLVTQEAAMPAANRNFFNAVDFTGTTTIPMASVDDVLNRVVRSCGGRSPTATETSLTEAAVAALNSAPNFDADAICGSWLASYSGVTN